MKSFYDAINIAALLFVRICANFLLMRVINFYRTENDKCPVEDYLDTLSDKQVEKVFFVLQLVESLEIVPRKFFKKLDSTDDIWEVRVQLGNNIFDFSVFLMMVNWFF
jgi:hypothetical protein